MKWIQLRSLRNVGKSSAILGIAWFALLASCTGIPEGLSAVAELDRERYLGQWYEIARLDHRFERGLEAVTATYALREDGGIRVLNRGFDPVKGAWKEAEGRAYPVDDSGNGRLKVSFFGPFFGGYNVLEIDDAYSYSVVAGPTREYAWILSRTPGLPEAKLAAIRDRLRANGFAVDKLIYPDQSRHRKPGDSDP